MNPRLDQLLDSLRQAADPDALSALAPLAAAARPRVNAHIHLPPNFSAFDSVEQAVELAAAQGVRVLGCSNYYDFQVYGPFAAAARPRGIFPLFGLEIISLDEGLAARGLKVNDPGNPGRFYLCGKAIGRLEPPSSRGRMLLERIRLTDVARISRMIELLEGLFASRGLATGLTYPAIVGRVVARHGAPPASVYLQERHVCQAFQEVLFDRVAPTDRAARLTDLYGGPPKADPADPVAIQDELRSRLMKKGRPAYVDEAFVSPAEARELILDLGGIPCYPVLADGASPVCPFEETPEHLVGELLQRGFTCAEFIPLRNRPETLERYAMALRAAGLVLTAGTEHNTLTLGPIAPACLGGAPIPPAVAELFWEGACVAAAHQFLGLHGRSGFVDAAGLPNAAYGSAEERIAAFRRMGEALLGLYFGRFGDQD